MKTKMWLFLILPLCLFVALVSVTSILNAAGTASGAWLTNIASVSWTGGGAGFADTNANTNVGTIYGAVWIGEADKNISAGLSVTNVTTFENVGNIQVDYNFGFYEPSAGTKTEAWVAYLSNTSGGSQNGSNITVTCAVGDVKTVRFVVNVPVAEANGNTGIYRCVATNTAAVAANATRYTGYNNITYGGNIGQLGAGVGVVFLSNNQATATSWTITVQAATMRVAKDIISIINPAPYNALANPVPGAAIHFRLRYWNAGSAVANGVVINDYYHTGYMAMSNGGAGNQLRFSLNTNHAWADASGNPITFAGDADTGCTNNDYTLTFTPTNGTATATPTGGAVANGAMGAYFYILTVN